MVCSPPLYCDTGPYQGDTRVDFRGSVYMSPEEAALYYKTGLTVSLIPDEESKDGDVLQPDTVGEDQQD